ncbi:alpha/beta fold hydrolase [Egibacter rhizosphaerae]|uniref:Alpha/beta fold hydrolase n=1 Tax=Egibacter rhizosphaerae TaxID=1670831 RepID=A0A411YHL3_9ACTN|nr:alpha/beta hydrolase [Egibacter rhizosphaerae]QBI20707.1 alpha/beta fold hydrolase [Egibacter rhizosphaerae]
MTDPVERTVRTDRLAIRTWERGDGEPILFVHGNLSSGSAWYEQLRFLSSGYRGIAPDLRGYGSTEPAPVDATRGLRDWSDDLAALLEVEDISGCHVVGHSMGGGVAMQLALDHPDRIRSLTLVSAMSPYGFGGTRPDGTPCASDYAGSGGGVANPDLVRRIDEGDRSDESEASPRRVVRDLFFPSPELVREEDALVEAMLAGRIGDDFYPGDSVESSYWPYVSPGKRGVLNAISPRYCDLSSFASQGPAVPIMWLHGAEDRIIADGSLADLGTLGQLGAVPGWPGEDEFPPQPMVSQLRAVLEAHPGPLSTVWREGVGHFPFVQEPDRFAETLARHLDDARE